MKISDEIKEDRILESINVHPLKLLNNAELYDINTKIEEVNDDNATIQISYPRAEYAYASHLRDNGHQGEIIYPRTSSKLLEDGSWLLLTITGKG